MFKYACALYKFILKSISCEVNTKLTNCLHLVQNSTYQSTLTRAGTEVFKAPAPTRRARIRCFHASTCSQRDVADGREDGERPGGGKRAATHGNIM